jgi:hypothetical protein
MNFYPLKKLSSNFVQQYSKVKGNYTKKKGNRIEEIKE